MSLDLGLADARMLDLQSSRLYFLDDGMYSFCFPFFQQLERRTGEMIDLYDCAWFGGGQLEEVASTLAEIRECAATMPSTWKVCVGTQQVQPEPAPPRPILERVERTQLLELLTQFDELVSEARRSGAWIACQGD